MPPLTVPPQPQGLQCPTFMSPPLDGSLSLPELCDWHAQNSPDHTLFVYARESGTIEKIHWSQGSRAIRRAAQLVRERLIWEESACSTPVVAILSSSDAIPFYTILMGILRANCAAFPISPRNSPTAVSYLLEQVGACHILVGRDQAMQDLVSQSLDMWKSRCNTMLVPGISPMPTFTDLYSIGETASGLNVPYERHDSDTPALIMHSSGTTAFPKPIHITLRRLLQIARAPCYGECDLAGKVLSLHTSPMYHAMGVYLTSFAITSGMCIGLPAPRDPVPVLTADSAMRGIMAVQSDYIVAVPSMVEAWSRNPDYVEWLTHCRGVLFGGGPLDIDVGNFLASSGVRLCIEYGSTECGALSMFLRADITGADWQYFRYARHANVRLEPAGTHDQYEAIILSSDLLNPCVHNKVVDGVDGYATSDVLEEHPSKKGFFRIIGRADDQIMHSTGEKTNPGPLERMMKEDHHIAASVIFGRGRFQAGILVEPKAEFAFEPADEVLLAVFRNKIWPTVQRLNAYAPQHSRLFKEMILVAKPTKPFSFTEKNNVRRGAVLKDYEEEINALYAAVDTSMQVNTPYPAQWRVREATEFVRGCIIEIMGCMIPDDDDIFHHGCDSLQATYIRNSLLCAINKFSTINTHSIPEDFVYESRTISRLGVFVSAVVHGYGPEAHSSEILLSPLPLHEMRIEAMHAMVARHAGNFPIFSPSGTRPSATDTGDVVLLTGTTGNLGCHLLVQLASKAEVARVYAFNRPSRGDETLQQRQETALVERGLNPQVLDSGRVVLLEGDLVQPMFGLPKHVYNEMHSSITHIIHNAWPIDFALKLASFEPQVQGVRSLVDFALTAPIARSKPPQFQFISSIGIFQNVPAETHCAEAPAEAIGVAPTGYAESKWVSEEIIYKAASETTLLPLVVRVGQMCGGPAGAWNFQEWFPSMVQSAHVLGCIPDDTRDVDWIPADLAALSILDFCKYPGPAQIVHLRHPRPVSWQSVAMPVSQELSVQLVPYSEWFARLEASNTQTGRSASTTLSNEGAHTLHALHLTSFYRNIANRVNSGPNALGMVKLDLKQALNASPSLADPKLRQLRVQDVRQWLTYWRKTGMFS